MWDSKFLYVFLYLMGFCLSDVFAQPAIVQDWSWIENERGEEVSESYPEEIDYELYASHPELRVIGVDAYDKNGVLVGRHSIGIDENHLLEEIQKDYIQRVSIDDYKKDKYNFSRENIFAQNYVKFSLGLTKQKPQYNAQALNIAERYLRQLHNDHIGEAHCFTDIIRITDTSFVVMLGDEDEMPNCPYLVEYKNDGKYFSKYSFKLCWDYEEGVMEGQEDKKEHLDSNVINEAESKEEPQIYKEEPPTPTFDIHEFLRKKLKYPKVALENNISGKVIVEFCVEIDGTISGIRICSTPDMSLAKEAERVVSLMPKWNPGKINGEIAKVKMTMPITFKPNY